MTKKSNTPNLENSLDEINQIIAQMEKGELNLEQSLVQFERGVKLIKNAQKILQTAEQKVQILLSKQGEDTLTDYESDKE